MSYTLISSLITTTFRFSCPFLSNLSGRGADRGKAIAKNSVNSKRKTTIFWLRGSTPREYSRKEGGPFRILKTLEKKTMSKKIFIGGLPWSITSETLADAFSPYGEIVESKVIVDRDTGRSRGFGFVTFEDTASVEEAIREMDGQELNGRIIRVDRAKERSRPAKRYY